MEDQNKKRLKDITDYINMKDSFQKHLNGYIYDSLVYRYIRARQAMAQWEKERDPSFDSFKVARRDIIRFCEILEEAIGEHD